MAGGVKSADGYRKRMPSVYFKWLWQGFFYCLSFFAIMVNLVEQTGTAVSFMDEHGIVVPDSLACWQIYLFPCLLTFFSIVFLLLLEKRKVSKRNSALSYSLILLMAVSAHWNLCVGNAVALTVVSAVVSLSFSLFWLSYNAANEAFGILFGMFLKKRRKTFFLAMNLLVIAVSFALVLGLYHVSSDGIFGFSMRFPSPLLCLVTEVVSIVFLANNAFTSRRRMRLAAYDWISNKNSQDDRLPQMRRSAYDIFMKHHPAHFADEIVMSCIRIGYHVRVVGEENLSFDDFPAVFVCNHGHELGPICGTTFTPTYLYPWVHAEMCKKDLATERMWKYTFGPRFNNSRFGYFLTKLIAVVVTYVIGGTEPLAVHRDSPREIMKLFHETRDRLIAGGNVLIFPEDPSKSDYGGYQQGSTGGLYTGFAQIGKIYSSETGRDLHFYPMFISKKKRTLFIGKPITYDFKTDDPRAEKERVAKELQERMNAFV